MFKNFFKSDCKPVIVLILYGFVIFFVNMGGWDLCSPDEPRFGQVAKEMIQTGNYIVPHVNGEQYSDKPPLNFWITAAISKVFYRGNVTEVAARLPSALGGLGGLIVVFFMAKWLYDDRRTAFLSSVILGTCAIYFYQSRSAQLDMALSFWVYLSILAFVAVYTRKTENPFVPYIFWIAAALATLTKGPPGFIIPFGAVITFLIANKQFKEIRRLKPLTGFIVFAVIALSWVIPAALKSSGGYSSDLLWYQIIVRYFHAEHHNQPIYYYVKNLIPEFLPWSFFLPFAFYVGYKTKGKAYYTAFKFSLCWFLFTLIFFNISPGKRSQYLLPMYPALAMIVGFYWNGLIEKSRKMPKQVFVPIVILAVGLMGFAVFLGINADRLADIIETDLEKIEDFPIILLLAGLAISGVAVTYALINRKAVSGFVSLALASIVLYGTTILVLFPALNDYRSGRPLCDFIVSMRKPNERVGTYKIFRADFIFYGDYFLEVLESGRDVADFLDKEERVLCIVRTKKIETIQQRMGDKPLFNLFTTTIGHRKMPVVSNKQSLP